MKNKKDSKRKLVKSKYYGDLDPLESIKSLKPEQTVGILAKATSETIISSIPVLNKLFEWTERIDQASREEKLKALLIEYIEYTVHFESLNDAVAGLKLLTSTRGGQTLFRKIIQIIDKGTEDIEWIRLLAMVLQRISETEFEKYFDAQMFILSQIDRLTPQALIILSKYDIWKKVNIQNTTTTSGKTVSGDWVSQATMFMRRYLNIKDLETGARVNHSFCELESSGMIELSGHQLKLTAVGIEIYRTLV